ncbi:MAG: 3'-5' exonuclease [Candidatus Peribacteraceae bacterium]|nr:3'-5' exonuclease [Candidatus Peribacteraceae bacterium]
MIFFDTETTGLLKPAAASLADQPHIVEFFGLKVDDDFNVVEEVSVLIKPPIPMPEEVIRIHHITDDMVAEAPPFRDVYDRLVSLFLGETTMVAHNLSFDAGMLKNELRRISCDFKFPWPPQWHCTVEKSRHIHGRRLKLTQLHQIATGKPHQDGAHRADEDVYALIRCYIWMKKQGMV